MFASLQPHVLERCAGLLDDCRERPSALFLRLCELVDEAISKKRLSSAQRSREIVQRFIDGRHLPHDLTREEGWTYEAIVGGEKRFHQEDGGVVLLRDDGAWFHFTITLRYRRAPAAIELLGYNFEIVFPHGPRGPRFLRWDFNPPGHTNAQRSLRAHLHPGVDEEAENAQVPTPVMHPTELLSLFIERLRW